MSAIADTLREELKDAEYSEGYSESFLDSYIATQIKVLREQHGLSQQALANLIGSKQGVVSRIEDVNYSKWNVSTLKKLARAFRVRLKVSFETYGSLLAEVDSFSRASLQRVPRESDPILSQQVVAVTAKPRHRRERQTHPKRRPPVNLLRMPPMQERQNFVGQLTEGATLALNAQSLAQGAQGFKSRLLRSA